MIRFSYIQNIVLNIYRGLPQISFPIDVESIIKSIPNCKYLSYQDFAALSGCSLEDVFNICESKHGCTQYDVFENRYLILTNRSTLNNNNLGRQRWTISHELGHVVCGHHNLLKKYHLCEGESTNDFKDIESEADYFAAMLLAPFPLYKTLSIKSPSDIQRVFGLSKEASQNRYKQYGLWLRNHKKTAWENDMIKIYVANKKEGR